MARPRRDPVGGAVQNLFDLRQLENQIGDEANELLLELFDDIAGQLGRVDPTGADLSIRDQRVQDLIDEIAGLTGSTFNEIWDLLEERVTEVGVQQSEWAGQQLERSIGPSNVGAAGVSITAGEEIGRDRIRAIVENDPFQGATLRDWAENQERRVVFQVRRQVQLGLSQNETLGDIVRRVRGRQAGFIRKDPETGQFVPQGTRGADVRPRFEGGVLGTTTRETRSIVRTAITHTASRSHRATYEANDDVTTGFRYVATLDSRTTIICMNLDGRTWEHGDPDAKLPPQHFGCRSAIAPIVDWESLGVDPPDEGTRVSADGPVDSSTTYEQWLENQDEATQVEVLGKTRAKLFRQGKVDLTDMVKSDGRRVTVDELREMAEG